MSEVFLYGGRRLFKYATNVEQAVSLITESQPFHYAGKTKAESKQFGRDVARRVAQLRRSRDRERISVDQEDL